MTGVSAQGWLKDILRCPVCHGSLTETTDETGQTWLVCEGRCELQGRRRRYPVEDGIPVLLPDASEVVSD